MHARIFTIMEKMFLSCQKSEKVSDGFLRFKLLELSAGDFRQTLTSVLLTATEFNAVASLVELDFSHRRIDTLNLNNRTN